MQRGADHGFIVGIDTGGTFTDIVILHPGGQITINKSATTPKDFSQGVMDAIVVAAQSLGMTPKQFLQRTANDGLQECLASAKVRNTANTCAIR